MATPTPPPAPAATPTGSSGDDRAPYRKDRLKFGVASLMYSGDEIAFSPLHTAVIRSLGGGDVHLGIMGAILQSVGQLSAWIGTLLLRLTHLNRQAMVIALIAGAASSGMIVGTLLFASRHAEWATVCLYLYLTLVTLMAMLTGGQQNIASSWIGDLVPTHQRGWFVSGMAIIANIGLVLLQLTFAWLARDAGLPGFAGIVGLITLNTLVAIWLVSTITNRASQAVRFFSREPDQRVDYLFRPMWLLIWFECAWRSGRIALMAFATAYLIDHFGYKLDRIILIHMIVNVVNVLTLYVAGLWSDRIGILRPLALISAICGASMLLWVSSAWWGIMPILIYQFVNGAAGSTHWMLLNNLSLEVYPAKGRSNFLSFSRIVFGIFAITVSTAAGFAMAGIRGWSIELWGAEFNHYHIFFLGCTAATLSCLIPLWIVHAKVPLRSGRHDPVTSH